MPEAPALAPGGGLAAHGPAAVHIIADPAEVLVIDYGWSAGVDQYDLVELLSAVLGHPVGVEDLHIAEAPSGSLLCDPLNGLGHGHAVEAHLAGLSVSLVAGLLSAAAPDLDPGHHYALLGLIAQRPGPIQPGGPLDPLNGALLAPGLEPALAKCAHIALSGRGPGITDIAVKRLHRLTLTGST